MEENFFKFKSYFFYKHIPNKEHRVLNVPKSNIMTDYVIIVKLSVLFANKLKTKEIKKMLWEQVIKTF